MNSMCLNCPRYVAGYDYKQDESLYNAHYCPGTSNEVYTGCIRKPYNPMAREFGLVYNVIAEKWERDVKAK